MQSKLAKPKHKTLLWWVGVWATIWWAVSGFYIVLVIWVAKDFYIEKSNDNVFYKQDWSYAISQSISNKTYLAWLFFAIILGWLILALFWFRALRLRRISFRAGLKDLFLTIR